MIAPSAVLTFLLLSTAFNLVIGGTEARWRLYGWRDPSAGAEIAWPAPVKSGAEKLSFDLIVPLRDEANVIGETLRGLLRQSHPRLHIVVSLCDDDESTISAVRSVVSENLLTNRITIVTDHYENPTKAQQLNRALEVCMGDVVGVIDAEDDVAENLLVHAEGLLTHSGADVVQGGVQLMNLGVGIDKWFQVHNVLEYFFWFTSRMAFHPPRPPRPPHLPPSRAPASRAPPREYTGQDRTGAAAAACPAARRGDGPGTACEAGA